MIDNINAAPDYGDEPPFACSTVAVVDGDAYACSGTPGHAGRHTFHLFADEPPARYALVEQMGHRSTIGAVRETTFLGEPMLGVTDLKTGREHLVSPKSLYEITWLTESDARARAKPWTATALPASPWGGEDKDGYPWTDPDEGKDDGMSAAERDAYDREGEFRLDAADEARDLEREAEANL